MSFLSKLNEIFSEKPEPIVVEQKPVELKKRTMKLVSRKETVDLGVTYVLVKFEDGRELVGKVYGSFYQSTDAGQDESLIRSGSDEINVLKEPSVKFEKIVTSLEIAQYSISNLKSTQETYVDCPRVPTKAEVGKVITATILRTESNLEEVTKYSVEKI